MAKHDPQPRVVKIAVIERALAMMATPPNTIIETGTGHGDLRSRSRSGEPDAIIRSLARRGITAGNSRASPGGIK